MRTEILGMVTFTAMAGVLIGIGPVRADVRMDTATNTALAVGRAIGAASACPDIPRPRIKALTDRFQEAAKKFATKTEEVGNVTGTFEQGVFFGGLAVTGRQTSCRNAASDLADWENLTIPLLQPSGGTATSAPAAAPKPAPQVAVAAPLAPPPAPAPVAPPAAPAPAANATESRDHGVTEREIRFGIVAPFSGPAAELGKQMRIGIETAFSATNDAGGVNGRQLKLVAADDGYEPARTPDAMKQLFEQDRVFGFVVNVGTPTTAAALPYAMAHRALFFGAFTGAPLLRNDPPDRYVFNYRASYGEETYSVVHYLVKVRRLRPEQIAVFAQQDGYGDAGFEGVAAAIRTLSPTGDSSAIQRFGYQRNTDDVDAAIGQLQQYQRQHAASPIKAVVMIATAKAATAFIGKTRDRLPGLTYTNVSFVGSTALAHALMALGPKYASSVIVTQVVPSVDSYASVVLNYKAALAKYFPGESPDYVSFEAYLDANLLIEGLRRAGAQLDTERLVAALETMQDFDLGVGPHAKFSSEQHQALHKVWGTQIDDGGHFKAIALE